MTPQRTWYVGLSNTGHDPAIAIVDPNGCVAFAEATERFTQVKRAWGVPPDIAGHLAHAIDQTDFEIGRDRVEVSTCWKSVQSRPAEMLKNPLMSPNQLSALSTYQASLFDVSGASFRLLDIADEPIKVRQFEHHSCHAAAAVYFSDARDAVCLVVDGEGETGAVSQFSITNRRLSRDWRSWNAGASLGLYYSWLTLRCGFSDVLGEEWKVMGLAAFGTVREELVDPLQRILSFKNHRPEPCCSEVMAEVEAQVRAFARGSSDPVMQAADLAASGQYVYGLFADELLSGCAKSENRNLLLTGGCALNSSYNGTIRSRFGFEQVDVPPCPADDGNAIGAALLAWSADNNAPIPKSDRSAYFGSLPDRQAIARCMAYAAGSLRITELAGDQPLVTANLLAKGKIIGVMKGSAEFGPRALGNRSILADPRSHQMKDRLNKLVKGREAYRPFAPVIAEHLVDDWFQTPEPSPYMAKTLQWRSTSKELVPAVVHTDGTGRLQTVRHDQNPWLADLLEAFERISGVPIILNTSLNIMGKPIAHSVEDAVAMLMTTGLDAVLLENVLIEKPS